MVIFRYLLAKSLFQVSMALLMDCFCRRIETMSLLRYKLWIVCKRAVSYVIERVGPIVVLRSMSPETSDCNRRKNVTATIFQLSHIMLWTAPSQNIGRLEPGGPPHKSHLPLVASRIRLQQFNSLSWIPSKDKKHCTSREILIYSQRIHIL